MCCDEDKVKLWKNTINTPSRNVVNLYPDGNVMIKAIRGCKINITHIVVYVQNNVIT